MPRNVLTDEAAVQIQFIPVRKAEQYHVGEEAKYIIAENHPPSPPDPFFTFLREFTCTFIFHNPMFMSRCVEIFRKIIFLKFHKILADRKN